MPWVPVVYIRIARGVELTYASTDEKSNGDATEPPSSGNACGEARHYEEDSSDNVTDDG